MNVTAKIGTLGLNLEIRRAVVPPCVNATIAPMLSNVKVVSEIAILTASCTVLLLVVFNQSSLSLYGRIFSASSAIWLIVSQASTG